MKMADSLRFNVFVCVFLVFVGAALSSSVFKRDVAEVEQQQQQHMDPVLEVSSVGSAARNRLPFTANCLAERTERRRRRPRLRRRRKRRSRQAVR